MDKLLLLDKLFTHHNKKNFCFYARNVGMNLGYFRAADSKNDISFPKLALLFEIKGIFEP